MIAKDTATIVGKSVLLTGEGIVPAVEKGYTPLVIVWASSTAAAVHVGVTVHQTLPPADVVAILRSAADDLERRADELPREAIPLPAPIQGNGIPRPDDSLGSGDYLGSG